MILFDNVTKYFMENGQKRFILKNASFEIPHRARIAVLPEEPADGISILKLISGTLPANHGKIITYSKVSWIVGEPIGIVGDLSFRQNIKLVCGINGVGRGKSNQIVDMIADFTGIGKHVDAPLSSCSQEMKSRLMFALSLSFQFDFYLVGKKTSIGSGDFKLKSQESFHNVMQTSGLILGHPNLRLARKLCDSALVLSNGEVKYYPVLTDAIECFKSMVVLRKKSGTERKPATARLKISQ